jgi:Cdc6-like AAA superfamily ATPase
MRDDLVALERGFAFQTSARFDLLAVDHVSHLAMGAGDVEGSLARAIERGEGVVAVTGRMGSGKSSVIAAVTDALDEGFVPLRVTVVGVAAGDPVAFARHVMHEVRDLPETRLTEHERAAVARATATSTTSESRRELRAGFEIVSGLALTPKLIGDVQTIAGDALEHAADSAQVMSGLQRLLDAFWRAGRCPVLIVDDTDHWGGSPDVANAFFDQTARAVGRLDAVLVVAAQSDYVQLGGYQRVRHMFTAEIELPAPPDPALAITRVLQRRIDDQAVRTDVATVLDREALELVVDSYAESVADGRAGDMRRTLAVVRNALELAVDDPTVDRIGAGHVQEAMARNPLAPGSALA